MDQAVLKGILSSLISTDFVKADLSLAKILIRGFTFYVKFPVHWSSRIGTGTDVL